MELLSKSAEKDSPYFTIGKILSAHSLRGVLKFHYLGDLPEQLDALKQIFIQAEPEGEILQGPFTVKKISHHKGQIFLLTVAEINDRTAAETLTKQFIAMPKTEAIDLPEETYYIQDLIGFVCKDLEDNVLGYVKHIVQGHQDLVVIENETGKEHWVPFVFEMVPEVNVEERHMVITAPDGLFDL